jgi:hypothetical protein
MVDDCIGGVGIWKNLMSERTRVVTHMLGVSAFGNHAHITFTNHNLPDTIGGILPLDVFSFGGVEEVTVLTCI